MSFLSKRELMTGGVTAAALVLLAYWGVTEMLGAHPWWAFKVGYVGVIIGVVIYVVLSFWRGSFATKALMISAALLAMSLTVWIGKARFSASYAEDAVAGRMWFFGWIGIVAMLFVLVVHLIGKRV